MNLTLNLFFFLLSYNFASNSLYNSRGEVECIISKIQAQSFSSGSYLDLTTNIILNRGEVGMYYFKKSFSLLDLI